MNNEAKQSHETMHALATAIKCGGLYANFTHSFNEGESTSSDFCYGALKEYFKDAKDYCEIFQYSNPIDPSLKNAIVHIQPKAFDLIEVIDKKWLDDNLDEYFKTYRANAYQTVDPYTSYVLCVSKAFKQIVLLEVQCLGDPSEQNANGHNLYNVLSSKVSLNYAGIRSTDSLEYAIIDSCFYHKDKYYKGIDWEVDDDKKHNGIVGYSGEFYNQLFYRLYDLENEIEFTNFSWSIENLLKDYLEIEKYSMNLKLRQLKEKEDKMQKTIDALDSNSNKVLLEAAILGG